MGRCLEIVLTDLGEIIGTGLYTSLRMKKKQCTSLQKKKYVGSNGSSFWKK